MKSFLFNVWARQRREFRFSLWFVPCASLFWLVLFPPTALENDGDNTHHFLNPISLGMGWAVVALIGLFCVLNALRDSFLSEQERFRMKLWALILFFWMFLQTYTTFKAWNSLPSSYHLPW